jgi:hypothetical protein
VNFVRGGEFLDVSGKSFENFGKIEKDDDEGFCTIFSLPLYFY